MIYRNVISMYELNVWFKEASVITSFYHHIDIYNTQKDILKDGEQVIRVKAGCEQRL